MLIPFLLLLASPTLLGVLLGFVIWFLRRHERVPTGRSMRVVVGVAAGLLVLLVLRNVAAMLYPFGANPLLQFLLEWRYLLPLVVGVVALAILIVPVRRRRGSGAADLDRRTPLSFACRGAIGVLAALVILSVGVAIFAGRLSTVDDLGRYRMIWIDLGTTTGGTTIYGWYYSVPAFVLLAAVLGLVTLNLVLIARPPLSADTAGDRLGRWFRTRAVLWLAAAAVSLHLASVLRSLAGTSAARVSAETAGELGTVSAGTSFAALGPVMWGGWAVATVVGTTLCVSILLSVVPIRTRAPSRVIT